MRTMNRVSSAAATTSKVFSRSFVLIGLFALLASAARAEEASSEAIQRAHKFLSTPRCGKDVIGVVHFGATYTTHTYLRTLGITTPAGTPVAGHFALVYHYEWDPKGWTNVAFLCDTAGSIYDVRVTDTNAILQQPYATADATIQLVGNALLAAYKDKLTAADQKQFQKLLDNADSRGLLRWSLKMQQALGK